MSTTRNPAANAADRRRRTVVTNLHDSLLLCVCLTLPWPFSPFSLRPAPVTTTIPAIVKSPPPVKPAAKPIARPKR